LRPTQHKIGNFLWRHSTNFCVSIIIHISTMCKQHTSWTASSHKQKRIKHQNLLALTHSYESLYYKETFQTDGDQNYLYLAKSRSTSGSSSPCSNLSTNVCQRLIIIVSQSNDPIIISTTVFQFLNFRNSRSGKIPQNIIFGISRACFYRSDALYVA